MAHMSGLWDWTLRAYAQPGAAEACLDLQDQHGQNTSLLLWAVWSETADPARPAQAWGTDAPDPALARLAAALG